MSGKRLAIILILINFLTQPLAAFAQTSTSMTDDAWEVVKAVPFGAELEVKLGNRETLKGRLHSVDDATLRLSRKDEITNVNRADVMKVYRLYPKSEGFKRLTSGVGATIGGGIGLTVGISAGRGSRYDRTPSKILLLPLVGTALGAIGGYLIGDRMKGRLLIYDDARGQQAAPLNLKAKQP